MKRYAVDGVPSGEEALGGLAESWPPAICYSPSSPLTPEGSTDRTRKGKLIELSMSVSR
jgi:hypothetical protein